MPRGLERLTGFIATIKKPDDNEAIRIITAQGKNRNRQVICTFNAGLETESTVTRIPYRDIKHDLRHGIESLFREMQTADLVHIVDSSDR